VSQEVRVALEPQPKYGMPFQILGDGTGRFYNESPSYPRNGPMFSYAWTPPRSLKSVRVEHKDGVYQWVGVNEPNR
jgi:hypothetical protein